MYLRSGLLALLVVLISSRLTCAQSSECIDHSTTVSHELKQIKINIVGVEFRGENSLSDALRSQLADTIQRSNITVSPEEPDTDWANGLRAVTINKALHTQGYFRASTEVTPYLVKAESEQRSYIVIFTIEDGPQYRIGEMQVRDATVFAPTELREQIPLKPGEVFDEAKVWQGIKSITRLYGAKGYIDMTAGLTAGIDESRGLINASVELREGTQYRVGTVKILGLGRNSENRLKSLWEPGQVFDSQSLENFVKENKSLLPIDASAQNDITVRRDSDDGTVEITLDFRRCSKA